MSHDPDTLYQTASLRHDDLVRDAANERLAGQLTRPARPARSSWLSGIVDLVAGLFRRQLGTSLSAI